MRIGDVAVIDAQPAELPNGRLVSRALDNRLGSYVALQAARIVAEAGGAQWELAAVAAAQEEITFGGSRTSAFALEPDAAIVVDVTHATDAPGIEVKESGKHELGSGPVLSRGSTLNQRLFELLYDAAEAEKIPFTLEATARATGTDADAVHLSRGGVPTALVSIPIRYMHSPVELVAARRRRGVRAADRRRRAAPAAREQLRAAERLRRRPARWLGDDLVGLAGGAADRQHAQALRPREDLALVSSAPTRTSVSLSSSTRSPSMSIQPEPAERDEDLLLRRSRRDRARGSRRSPAAAGSPACPNAVTPSSARAFTNPPPKPASMSLMRFAV